MIQWSDQKVNFLTIPSLSFSLDCYKNDFQNLWPFDSPSHHIVFIFTLFYFKIYDFAPYFKFFWFFGFCFDARESGPDKIRYQQYQYHMGSYFCHIWSNVTKVWSHVIVLLLFLTFDGFIVTLDSINSTFDHTFVTFSSTFIFFSYIWQFHHYIKQYQHHM